MTTQFPKDFFWGTATASFQIEGATQEDGRGESIWDRFAATPGHILTGETGDPACDSYHHYQDDIAIMGQLGVNAYRFSTAWPRIIPDGEGPINSAGLDYYDRVVDALLAAGITPFVTLYHWDLPQALQEQGGWANRATLDAYVRYADIVVSHLGDRVKWVSVICLCLIPLDTMPLLQDMFRRDGNFILVAAFRHRVEGREKMLHTLVQADFSLAVGNTYKR